MPAPAPHDTTQRRAWLWYRIHDTAATEATALAARYPGVDPASPDAAGVLARHRADARWDAIVASGGQP